MQVLIDTEKLEHFKVDKWSQYEDILYWENEFFNVWHYVTGIETIFYKVKRNVKVSRNMKIKEKRA